MLMALDGCQCHAASLSRSLARSLSRAFPRPCALSLNLSISFSHHVSLSCKLILHTKIAIRQAAPVPGRCSSVPSMYLGSSMQISSFLFTGKGRRVITGDHRWFTGGHRGITRGSTRFTGGGRARACTASPTPPPCGRPSRPTAPRARSRCVASEIKTPNINPH